MKELIRSEEISSSGTAVSEYRSSTTVEPNNYNWETIEKDPSDGKAWAEKDETGAILASDYSSIIQSQEEHGSELVFRSTYKGTWATTITTHHMTEIWAGDLSDLIRGRWGFNDAPPPVFSEAAFTAALADARQGGYDLLTELAEAPETWKMLKEILPDAFSALKDYRKQLNKLDPSKLARWQKLPPKVKTYAKLADMLGSHGMNAWLIYRYGITPLVLSVQEILETYTKKLGLYETYRGRDEFSRTEEKLWTVSFAPKSGLTLDIRGTRSVSAISRGWVKCLYTKQSIAQNMRRLIRIDPIGTAYELLPLSFVVDWFVNVGDFISAMSISLADSEVATKSFQLVIEDSYHLSADSTLFESGTKWELVGTSPLLTRKSSSYWRKVSDPSPSLSFWQKRLSAARTADAVALSWQFLRSQFRRLK